jgi:hypothetical protein
MSGSARAKFALVAISSRTFGPDVNPALRTRPSSFPSPAMSARTANVAVFLPARYLALDDLALNDNSSGQARLRVVF